MQLSRSRTYQLSLMIGLLGLATSCSSTPPGSAEEISPVSATPDEGRPCGKLEPPRLIHGVNPRYPQSLRSQGIKGTVVLEGLLTSHGTVVNPRVIESTAGALSQLASEAFVQRRYKPAICKGSGEPVPVRVRMTYTFS